MSDYIEKSIELKAPLSKVWKAVSDYKQFGEWFSVNLDGPFLPGNAVKGNMTIPSYEHIVFEAVVQKVEPENYFSYTWHPFAIDPEIDYSAETPTLVEFMLKEMPGGTHLTVKESGFDKVPAHRREEAFRMDEQGWAAQLRDIEKYVAKE